MTPNSITISDPPAALQAPQLSAPGVRPRLQTRDLLLTAAPFAVAAVLLGALAWHVVTWWGWEYTRPNSYYSHGPIVPVMSLFMLWHQRARLAAIPKQPSLAALWMLVPSAALLVFSLKADARALESLGLLGCVWSSVWLALGTRFFKAAWFPLLFLALMMPLPGPVLNDATLRLQMISTGFAAKLLNWTTFTNVRDGNLIQMSDFTLFVDVPCSGFKTLLALFTFNAFLAAMLDGPVNRRVLLFLLCAPLALVVNAVRIALIGVVGECMGVSSAHVFHDYSGVLTLTLGFVVLFGIARLLGCRKFAGLAIF